MELYTYRAKCISAYDGDTCDVEVDLGFDVQHSMRLRLWGIDTPEMRGSEKEFGTKVRDYVRNLILDKSVIIKTRKDKKGKYGRYLAEIFYNDGSSWINLNDELLEMGYAEPYMRD